MPLELVPDRGDQNLCEFDQHRVLAKVEGVHAQYCFKAAQSGMRDKSGRYRFDNIKVAEEAKRGISEGG